MREKTKFHANILKSFYEEVVPDIAVIATHFENISHFGIVGQHSRLDLVVAAMFLNQILSLQHFLRNDSSHGVLGPSAEDRPVEGGCVGEGRGRIRLFQRYPVRHRLEHPGDPCWIRNDPRNR